ncbi:MAG: hypothetical protein RMK62_01205, partial [Armatimonadota bacterium]|nr:hypothetical protein [Armatimonadota bacterium]
MTVVWSQAVRADRSLPGTSHHGMGNRRRQPGQPSSQLARLSLLVVAILTQAVFADGTDWKVYRHDLALSGVSSGRGNIVQPVVKWEYYLGTPLTQVAADREHHDQSLVDLDGDGQKERFQLDNKTIVVTDLTGKKLWSFTVDGHPLGGNVRVCKLFPNQKGLQIISFSKRMDTGEGQGYCFSFHRGVQNGELVWTTGPLTGQYSPTLIIDDVDGDGLPDIVTAPHYRVQIFSGQTGVLKAEVPLGVGRNYGILLSRPRRDRPQKDLYIIADFTLHVQCVRFQDGKWVRAWGYQYLADENAPVPYGREKYIRVGPAPVGDCDGDGTDEIAYMLIDGTADDRWHLIVRDCETGTVKADIAKVWVWAISDLNNDRISEIIYTPTTEKRPPTYCDLHIGHLRQGRIQDLAVLKQVRPILVNATLPATTDTIADEGLIDLLRADLDGDGLPEIFYGVKSEAGKFDDTFYAVSLTVSGRLVRKWRYQQKGDRLNLIFAGLDSKGTVVVRVRNLTKGKVVMIDGKGKVVDETDLGKPGGFRTMPIVVDLDGDGVNEIVVQNAFQDIMALRTGKRRTDPPYILWSVPGVAMNLHSGYTWNGLLCPQAADCDGDGSPEVVFATEDGSGLTALSCVDRRGRLKWSRSIDGCPWGGLQAGIDHWTFGRFTGRKAGLDIFVDLHRRSKGSGEGWVLRGDTGEVVWKRKGISAKEFAGPFGGGLPAVADVNGDGIDDIVQSFWTIYAAVSGNTGEPIFPPVFLPGPSGFGRWIAYSWPTVADLDGD